MRSPPEAVQSRWTWRDRFGALAVRCAYGRMRYTVQPGLYQVNSPGAASPVFASANYKLSFDHLRRGLHGIAAWILVLDTKGINVWCAAGKGTFGTEELIHRLDTVRLQETVTHRQLIVPQLGAPGIASHKVLRQSGFRVVYGPVRAQDIPQFVDAELKASPEMRRVQFRMTDRLAVIPVEMVGSAHKALLLAVVFALIATRRADGGSWPRLAYEGFMAGGLVLAGYLAVSVLTPALLPWLPGRAFSIKGAGAGLLIGIAQWTFGFYTQTGDLLAWLLLMVPMGAFMGLNLTGASTYTSLSGVKKETRLAVPWMIAAVILSVCLWFGSCGRV